MSLFSQRIAEIIFFGEGISVPAR